MTKFVGIEVFEIHDEVLFAPGGDITRWRNNLSRELGVVGREKAPVNRRSAKSKSSKTAGGVTPRGHLKANVKARTFKEGTKVLGIDLTSGAAYSLFVIRGTKGKIARGAGGKFGARRFVLPATHVAPAPGKPGGSFGKRRVQRFNGQEANNFLQTAFNTVSLRHPALIGRGHGLRKF